jgi:hypothetical protein
VPKEDGDTPDGDVVDGDVTDGDVIDGDVVDGDVVDGDDADGDLDLSDGDVDLDLDPDLEGDPDLDTETEEPGDDCVSGDDCCDNGYWVAAGDPCVSGQDAFSCTTDVCNAAHVCATHTLMTDKCLINSVCYSERQAKPGFQCVWCDPLSAPTGWTDKPNTESCDDGNLCTYDEKCSGGGACSPGTSITCTDDAGICGANRVCNGTDGCTVSYPDDQTTCETDNKTCTDDTCDSAGNCEHIRQSDTCYIGGVCYAHHAVNPENVGQWCDSATNAWADKP